MATPETTQSPTTEQKNLAFVARQPILDLDLNVVGYELLFRSGEGGSFPDSDDVASAHVLSTSFMDVGIDTLTAHKKAFVNFPRGMIVHKVPSLFPVESLTVEVLETVIPTPEVLKALEQLRDLGYTIALDDFEIGGPWEPHLGLADIVKIDFLSSTSEQRLTLRAHAKQHGFELLAEKVETREHFKEALAMGFTLFQGYFFFQPEIVSGERIEGFKANHLQILHESRRPEPDLDKLTDTIKTDVSLSYRLLRFINSAAFGWRKEVTSIRHALNLLGNREIRRWVTLVSMSSMLTEHPPEVLTNCVTRALFCEQLAPTVGIKDRGLDVYFLGLFSSLDQILGRDIGEVLAEMPLDDDVRAALEGEPGKLRQLLDLVVAYEHGDWPQVKTLVDTLGVDDTELPTLYREAVAGGSEIGGLSDVGDTP